MKLKNKLPIADCRLPIKRKSARLKFSTQNSKFKIQNFSGFTLIEIMVSIGIFALLIAALYSTWMLVIRATIVGKETAAQLQRERVAMRTIEDSLTCIQSHQASIDYYHFDIQNGDAPLLSFTAYLPDTFPRSGEFVGSEQDFHLRRLTFSLEPGDGNQKNLVLRQNPILMDLSPAEQSTPLILAPNVTDFLIECWDTNTMTWDAEWDATNMIPPLVRVTLGFGSKSAAGAQVITREISFPSGTMPTGVQMPNGYNGGGNNVNFNRGNNNNNPGQNNGGQNNQNSQTLPNSGRNNFFNPQ